MSVTVKKNGILLWRGLELGRVDVDRKTSPPTWTFQGTCKEAPPTFSSRELRMIRHSVTKHCVALERETHNSAFWTR